MTEEAPRDKWGGHSASKVKTVAENLHRAYSGNLGGMVKVRSLEETDDEVEQGRWYEEAIRLLDGDVPDHSGVWRRAAAR